MMTRWLSGRRSFAKLNLIRNKNTFVTEFNLSGGFDTPLRGYSTTRTLQIPPLNRPREGNRPADVFNAEHRGDNSLHNQPNVEREIW